MKTLFFRTRLVPWLTTVIIGMGLCTPVASAKKVDVTAEVLVFVDVSGSMIKNDPDNMRSPAIRLLAGMAPEDVRAGIYLFGTKVRELVPAEVMSRRWKNKAEKKSRAFRSRDMYTNIEAALLTANKNWMDSDKTKRSVILLTDGIVDIDKKKSVSDASRERILTEVLEQLKSNKVSVHTMALSENADHELLEKISMSTDGHYQKVNKADDLQRTFMRLFEQSAPQDTVPLKDNTFSVDSTISELTLLIFRKENAEPTQVITPEGETYHKDYSVDGLKWKHDAGYDLISINHPLPGQWQIVADEDPDNRAMVVTNLKLKGNDIPANVLNGEKVTLTAWLEERDKLVTKPEFLKLLSAKVISTENSVQQQEWQLEPVNENSQFTLTIGPEWQSGQHELILTIDSGTFVREKRISVKAHTSPIEVQTNIMDEDLFKELMAKRPKKMPKNILSPETTDEPTQGWQVEVKAMQDLIDLEASELLVEAKSQADQLIQVVAEKNEQGWIINFLPPKPGQYQLDIGFKGKTKTGRELGIKTEPLLLGEVLEATVVADVDGSEGAQVLPSMKEFIIPVVVGNLFFALLFLGWKLLKRIRENSKLQPEEAL